MRLFIRKLLRESLLTEKSINDISTDDFNIREIIDYWLMSNPSVVVDTYRFDMQDDYHLSPEEKESIMDEDEDDIIKSDRFKKWVRYQVEFKIDDTLDDISYKIENGKLNIWRVMTVDDEWLRNLPTSGSRLGRYWSFEEDSAEAHWGGKHSNTIKIKTSVNEEYIDWHQTIESNIDLVIGEDEKEITLFKNTPLNIESIELNGEVMDISSFKNKVFKA